MISAERSCHNERMSTLAPFVVSDLPTEDDLLARYVEHVIAAEGGNKTRAARRLGIDRRSLYRRLAAGRAA